MKKYFVLFEQAIRKKWTQHFWLIFLSRIDMLFFLAIDDLLVTDLLLLKDHLHFAGL